MAIDTREMLAGKAITNHSLPQGALLHPLREALVRVSEHIHHATRLIDDLKQGENTTLVHSISSSASESHILNQSLQALTKHLIRIREDEQQRNWMVEGLARFTEVIKNSNHDLKTLCDTIVEHLIRYLEASQGGLFILNEENKDEPHLELMACYAYSRKKYLKKKVHLGEGLVGQVFYEQKTIFLKKVPQDYMDISSGLGGANPSSVLIVPMLINEQFLGVVELASFETFQPIQIEFVEKVCENIASTISFFKMSQHTQQLLAETQESSRALMAQEEELRQNMEEMQATQEAMRRHQEELKNANERFQLVSQGTGEGLWEFRVDFAGKTQDEKFPAWFSPRFKEMIGFEDEEFPNLMSFWLNRLHPDDSERSSEAMRAHLYDKNSKHYDVQYRVLHKSGEYRWFRVKAATLRDEAGKPVRIAGSIQDIHEEKSQRDAVLRQKAELESFLNSSQDLIYILNKDYTILHFNQRVKDYYADFQVNIKAGLNLLDITPKQYHQDYKKAFDQALAGGSFESESIFEFGGEKHYLSTSGFPVKIGDKILGAGLIIRDISKLKETEQLLQHQNEELKASEEELRQNLEEMNATQEQLANKEAEIQSWLHAIHEALLVLDIDPKGYVTFINHSYLELFETEKQAVLGKHVREFNQTLRAQPEITERIWKNLHQGKPYHGTSLLKVGTVEKYLQETIVPIYNHHRELTKITVIAHDITAYQEHARASSSEKNDLENSLKKSIY